MIYISETLNAKHMKKDFSCGKEMLDRYLHKQASQDVKRKLAACFIVKDEATNLVKGYYTLANNSISQNVIPEKIRKQLPSSYLKIPTILLGRLAIDTHFQNEGLGKYLLIDALKRSYEISKTLGSFAVVVDPLDENAKCFYEKYGFIELPDSEKMFLAMKTIHILFEK